MVDLEILPTQPMIEFCDDLDAGIAEYIARGYRLDMIVPADSPTVARLSHGGHTVQLLRTETDEPRAANSGRWITGRAGMEYRDLIPDRLGGRLIASHIRLTKGGEVPDYVHYHKVRFQMIFCVAGAIRVVYEDQGPPFWLLPGDCVLQPPEIRHRVLEAEAGSEVVELGVPAVHETWVEHEITLPMNRLDAGRDFSGQRFVRHIAADAIWQTSAFEGCESSVTGIAAATDGLADVRVIRVKGSATARPIDGAVEVHLFIYLLSGFADVETGGLQSRASTGSAFVVPPGAQCTINAKNAEILTVRLSKL